MKLNRRDFIKGFGAFVAGLGLGATKTEAKEVEAIEIPSDSKWGSGWQAEPGETFVDGFAVEPCQDFRFELHSPLGYKLKHEIQTASGEWIDFNDASRRLAHEWMHHLNECTDAIIERCDPELTPDPFDADVDFLIPNDWPISVIQDGELIPVDSIGDALDLCRGREETVTVELGGRDGCLGIVRGAPTFEPGSSSFAVEIEHDNERCKACKLEGFEKAGCCGMKNYVRGLDGSIDAVGTIKARLASMDALPGLCPMWPMDERLDLWNIAAEQFQKERLEYAKQAEANVKGLDKWFKSIGWGKIVEPPDDMDGCVPAGEDCPDGCSCEYFENPPIAPLSDSKYGSGWSADET